MRRLSKVLAPTPSLNPNAGPPATRGPYDTSPPSSAGPFGNRTMRCRRRRRYGSPPTFIASRPSAARNGRASRFPSPPASFWEGAPRSSTPWRCSCPSPNCYKPWPAESPATSFEHPHATAMPRFHYQALDADQQLTTGEVEADAVAVAITQLEASGLTVLSIGFATAESTATLTTNKPIVPAPKLKLPPIDAARDEAILRTHLARTLERARPLTPALRAYAEEMPTGQRRRELA